MADQHSRDIVDQALALAKSHPHVPALDVLDLVMTDRHGIDPDFDAPGEPFGDWTDPPSPFGDLLRRAFAPNDIREDAAAVWASEDPALLPEQSALASAWQCLVIERFADRYRLWR